MANEALSNQAALNSMFRSAIAPATQGIERMARLRFDIAEAAKARRERIEDKAADRVARRADAAETRAFSRTENALTRKASLEQAESLAGISNKAANQRQVDSFANAKLVAEDTEARRLKKQTAGDVSAQARIDSYGQEMAEAINYRDRFMKNPSAAITTQAAELAAAEWREKTLGIDEFKFPDADLMKMVDLVAGGKKNNGKIKVFLDELRERDPPVHINENQFQNYKQIVGSMIPSIEKKLLAAQPTVAQLNSALALQQSLMVGMIQSNDRLTTPAVFEIARKLAEQIKADPATEAPATAKVKTAEEKEADIKRAMDATGSNNGQQTTADVSEIQEEIDAIVPLDSGSRFVADTLTKPQAKTKHSKRQELLNAKLSVALGSLANGNGDTQTAIDAAHAIGDSDALFRYFKEVSGELSEVNMGRGHGRTGHFERPTQYQHTIDKSAMLQKMFGPSFASGYLTFNSKDGTVTAPLATSKVTQGGTTFERPSQLSMNAHALRKSLAQFKGIAPATAVPVKVPVEPKVEPLTAIIDETTDEAETVSYIDPTDNGFNDAFIPV